MTVPSGTLYCRKPSIKIMIVTKHSAFYGQLRCYCRKPYIKTIRLIKSYFRLIEVNF